LGEIEIKTRAGSGVQVISRAADILRALEEENDGLSLGEIADRVSLARSTVQRIVKALSDEEFLMPASNRGRVKLGPGLVRLGSAANLEITQIAKPAMQELSRMLGETVDLSTLRQASAVFVAQVGGSQRLAAISRVGTVFPLHSTANGKAVLACLDPARRRELLAGPLHRDTRRSVTDAEELEREIRRVLKTGLAYDLEEHTDGICAVATAFLDAAGSPYALSVPVPRPRFDQLRKACEEGLLRTRDLLIRQVGGALPTVQ
jgi:DNA-binding IclR family transcriptional regulator